MKRSPVRWAVVVCLLALCGLTAAASAATLTVTSGSSYTLTARQTLTLDPGGLAIACDHSFGVSLNATTISASSLPASIPRFGSLPRGSTGNCSGGQIFTHLGLPWQLDASNGTGRADGTLLTIRNMQFERTIGALTCLYAGDLSGTVGSSGTVVNVSGSSVPLASGPFLCPDPGTMSGTFAVSPALVVTLR